MKRCLIASLCFCPGIILAGCSSFYPPWNNPRDYPVDYQIIKDKRAGIITMTDEQRAVVVVPGALNGSNADLRVCPEPPADAASDIANAFKAQIEAANANPVARQNAETQMSKESSFTLSAILDRTQGLELFRDGANTLCIAWLNDIYNNGDLDSWREDFRYLLSLSYQLINKEITSRQSGVAKTNGAK